MKRFLRYITILIGLGILLIYLLEYAYTRIYNDGSYRNKAMWIRDMKADTLDYAVFGSSMVQYTINPRIIEQKTGKKGVNLGINASGPFEVKIAVSQFLKNNSPKCIFVGLDYTFYRKTPDSIGQLIWLPYIKEKNIFEFFKPFGRKYTVYKQTPMYRYLKFDGSLGFRNVTLSALGKPPDFLANSGFKNRFGTLREDTPYPYSLERKTNKHIDEIISLAKKKQVALYFFTAPVYRAAEDFSVLEANVPNYSNLSKAIQKKRYFSDHTHLNPEGAKLFTQKFIETFFSNSPNY